ncbi:LysR substrate-binding domain-containing protein [Chitinasiproducens palmae]|uniref:Transcriptional regulator, LysR family n=1 Tax=Chitinasiproducens palmae TaxID=1770053 RepID=A0A1H2PK97_9BURK|nr:LysR substrate-binding domain-containing protein [Chitinasiproducens palmae]SDV46865.1 transcriptional regulator, LysR family [Chitinasiproducens palmae]
MDVRQMRYFVACVDAGSLSKAAVALSISQPSLSQQIAEMEDDLGVPLLLRNWSGVAPTEAGTALYRHAQSILKQMSQMRSEVRRGGHALYGQVAVGLPTSIASVLAVPLFERMRARYPGIQLQIFESMSGYLNELLANGRLDIAVLFRDAETRGVSVLPLFNEPLAVHGAAWIGDPQARTLRLSMLAGVPLVLPGRAHDLRLQIERGFASAGAELNVVADIESLPTMLELARRGEVATILSGFLTLGDRKSLPTRYLVEPSLERPVALCRLNSVPQTAASRAVQDCMQEIVADLMPTLPALST